MAAERIRLFVALDLPASARGELEHWRARVGHEVAGLRLVAPEALHATLCFLGWRSGDEIEQIGAACAAALGRCAPPELTLGEAVWLPARRPRVLAVRLDDRTESLVRIQATASAALSSGGWYAPETRPFLAHVTVARVAGRERVRPVELASPRADAFNCAAVTLYRSHLERTGARYEALRRIELIRG